MLGVLVADPFYVIFPHWIEKQHETNISPVFVEATVPTSRWSIPGPLYVLCIFWINTRPLCWIEQLFWKTSKHPKHRTNVVQGLLVYIHASKHDHLNNLNLLRLCEMCFFYSSSIILYVVVSNIFLFPSLPGEKIQFEEHIFQMGWNHQPDMSSIQSDLPSLYTTPKTAPTSPIRMWLHLPRLWWP